MKDPIIYILSCLVINFVIFIASKSYYNKKGDRRQGYCELEVQVKNLAEYVKTKVHTSDQVAKLEVKFDEKFDKIHSKMELMQGFMKSLIDREGS